MEKEERDKILSKIKKLMALGTKHEDTPEGVSARAKAKSLMEKYDVRFIDIKEDGTIDNADVIRKDIVWNKYRNDFERYLAAHISKTLDCAYVMRNKGTKYAEHAFIGTKTDIELLEWLFKFTRLQCYQLGERTGYKGKDLRTYYHGMLLTLIPKITMVFGEVKSEKRSDVECRDLVIVKDAMVTKKKAEEFPNLKKGRKGRPLHGNYAAYEKGMSDGKKVSVNKQVNGSSANTQIGG